MAVAQELGEAARRELLLVAELGPGVDLVRDGDELVGELIDEVADPLLHSNVA